MVKPKEAVSLLAAGEAPAGMIVSGVLDYSEKSQRSLPPKFPEGLQVDVLDLTGREGFTLPSGLRCIELNLSRTAVERLPDDLKVESRLDLAGGDRLRELPAGLTVANLILRGCTALTSLPEGLDVWFLELTGCWAFEHWPKRITIRGGRLQLRGCTALRSLPPDLKRLSALNVRECPNLASLPPDLVVTGWLDLGHSGIADESQFPESLAGTQLRWAGVNIDRRIAFHPEEIDIDEVLSERNAERRRVLLDRFGYTRFIREAHAEILNRDTDPGGERQLLKVALKDDEDLVALSCFCPSTQRQYIIRVPPTTLTCHQAAAWIAGFDNPDDYRPLIET
jgi:hypothetical protein